MSSSFALCAHPNPTPLSYCYSSSSQAIQVPLFTFNYQASHVYKYKSSHINGRKICLPSKCLQQEKNGEIISSYVDSNDADESTGNGSNPSRSFLSFLCPLLKLFSVSIYSSESPLTTNFFDLCFGFL